MRRLLSSVQSSAWNTSASLPGRMFRERRSRMPQQNSVTPAMISAHSAQRHLRFVGASRTGASCIGTLSKGACPVEVDPSPASVGIEPRVDSSPIFVGVELCVDPSPVSCSLTPDPWTLLFTQLKTGEYLPNNITPPTPILKERRFSCTRRSQIIRPRSSSAARMVAMAMVAVLDIE